MVISGHYDDVGAQPVDEEGQGVRFDGHHAPRWGCVVKSDVDGGGLLRGHRLRRRRNRSGDGSACEDCGERRSTHEWGSLASSC